MSGNTDISRFARKGGMLNVADAKSECFIVRAFQKDD
jgi:hypothetical protein